MLLSPLDERELAVVNHLPWRAWSDAWRLRLPPLAVRWLAETGSLTQKLRLDGYQVSVRRLSEGLTPQSEWQRQVLLLAGETPWLWGYTQISAPALAVCPALAAQGDRPIGDWLFGLGGAQRLSLEWAEVPTISSRLFAALSDGEHGLWGRRTRLRLEAFCQDGSPAELSLTELFLPGSALPPCLDSWESITC